MESDTAQRVGAGIQGVESVPESSGRGNFTNDVEAEGEYTVDGRNEDAGCKRLSLENNKEVCKPWLRYFIVRN